MTNQNVFSRTIVALLAANLLLAGCGQKNGTASDSAAGLKTTVAAVAIPDRYGAEASEAILRSGGNAVDAAIATGFVLAVTYPEAGNIGGGGFMLIRMRGQSAFLDYRETAPLAADRDMYLDAQGKVSGRGSLVGIRAVGVPGTVAGMWEAHKRYGSKPWRELVQPAIDLARDGFVVDETLAASAAEALEWFAGETNSDRLLSAMKAGEVLRQGELAASLQRIADNGPEGFYAGETAELIVKQMQHDGGLITAADLAGYRALWREPLLARWRDYDIVSAPPPSSGGIALVQLLKMQEALAPEFAGVAHNSTQYVHLIAEIEKRVYADRAEYLGDPDFVNVPVAELIDDDYLKRRASEVNSKAISTIEASPPGLDPPHTTHYSIVDGDGNAVSNTYTLNWSFGSGIVVEGAGILLNNEMDDFSASPGVPNIYGVVGSTANQIDPGKRMLSSMTPTILLKDGKVELVTGTPGGSTIITTVFQSIVNIVNFGMTPAEAAAASRFHHQLLPADLVTYSPSVPLPEETIRGLGDLGYRVEPHAWEYGDLEIVKRDGDSYVGGADPRRRGVARTIVVPVRETE